MPTLNEDPMQWEVELGHPHLFMGYHSLSKLVLESVGFSVGLLPGQLDRALVVSGPVVDSNSTPLARPRVRLTPSICQHVETCGTGTYDQGCYSDNPDILRVRSLQAGRNLCSSHPSS
jgi:hypothetical protein